MVARSPMAAAAEAHPDRPGERSWGLPARIGPALALLCVLVFAAELREEGYVFLRTPETILDPWLAELLSGVKMSDLPEPELP